MFSDFILKYLGMHDKKFNYYKDEDHEVQTGANWAQVSSASEAGGKLRHNPHFPADTLM